MTTIIILCRIDIECYYRFVRWFAFHLSNFDFAWEWKMWYSQLGDEAVAGAISDILGECLKLSYYSSLVKKIPKELHNWMPKQPEHVDMYDVQRDVHAATLLGMMQKKASADDVTQWLSTSCAWILLLIEGEFESNPEESVRLLMNHILAFGHRSLTHLRTILDRYKDSLIEMIRDSELRAFIVLDVNMSVWRHNPLVMEAVLEKLLMYGIVTKITAVSYLLSNDTVSKWGLRYGDGDGDVIW